MLQATIEKKFAESSERIGGYSGALAFLEQLPDRVARKVLKPAMQAADLVGMRAASAEAAKHAASTYRRTKTHLFQTAGAAEASRGTSVVGKVGYFGEAGSHGWLVEHGHRIVIGGSTARLTGRYKGRSPNAKDRNRTGKGTVSGQVPPHPILLPAYESSKGMMEQVFAAEVIARADREAEKLAKQTGAV